MSQVDQMRPTIAHAPLGYNNGGVPNEPVSAVPPPRAVAGMNDNMSFMGSPNPSLKSPQVNFVRPGHYRSTSGTGARIISSPPRDQPTSPYEPKTAEARSASRFSGRGKNELLSQFTRSSAAPIANASVENDNKAEHVDDERRKSLDLADFWATESNDHGNDAKEGKHETTAAAGFTEPETPNPQMAVFTPQEEKTPIFDALSPGLTSDHHEESLHDTETQSQYPEDEPSSFLRFKRPSFLAAPAPWRFGARSGFETAGSPVPSQMGERPFQATHTPQHSGSEVLFEHNDSPQNANARSAVPSLGSSIATFPQPPIQHDRKATLAQNRAADRFSALSGFFGYLKGNRNSDAKLGQQYNDKQFTGQPNAHGASDRISGMRHVQKNSLSERSSMDGEDPMTPYYDAPSGRPRGLTTGSDPSNNRGRYDNNDDDLYHKGYGYGNASLDDLSLVEHSTHPTKDSQMVGAQQPRKQWFFLPRGQARKTRAPIEPVHEKYFDDDEDPETGKPRYGLPPVEESSSRKRRSKIRNPICRCLVFLFFTVLVLAIIFLVICLIYFFAIFKWPSFTAGNVGVVSNVQLSAEGFNLTRIIDGTLSNSDVFEIDLRGFTVNAEYDQNGTFPFGASDLPGVSETSPLKLPKDTFVAISMPLTFRYLVSQDDDKFTFLKSMALKCGSDGSSADLANLQNGQEGYFPFAVKGSGYVKVLGLSKSFSDAYTDVAMVCDPIMARTVQQLLGYHGQADPNLTKTSTTTPAAAQSATAASSTGTGAAAFLNNVGAQSAVAASPTTAVGIDQFMSQAAAVKTSTATAPAEPVGGIGIDAFLNQAKGGNASATESATSTPSHFAVEEFMKAAGIASAAPAATAAPAAFNIDDFLGQQQSGAAPAAAATKAPVLGPDDFLSSVQTEKPAQKNVLGVDDFLNNVQAYTTPNAAPQAASTDSSIDSFLAQAQSPSAAEPAATGHPIDSFLAKLNTPATDSAPKAGGIDDFLAKAQSPASSNANGGQGIDDFLAQAQRPTTAAAAPAQNIDDFLAAANSPKAVASTPASGSDIDSFLAAANSPAASSGAQKNLIAAAAGTVGDVVTSTAQLAPAPANTGIGQFVKGLGSPAAGGAQIPADAASSVAAVADHPAQLSQAQYDALGADEQAEYAKTVEEYNKAYEAQHGTTAGSATLTPDQFASLTDDQRAFYDDMLKDIASKTASAAAPSGTSSSTSNFEKQYAKIFKGGLGSGASGGAVHFKRDESRLSVLRDLVRPLRLSNVRRSSHKKTTPAKVPVFSGGLGSPASGGASIPESPIFAGGLGSPASGGAAIP